MQQLKKVALALCLLACIGIGDVDKAHAEEAMPSSGIAYEDLNREIHKLETVYSSNKKDWASVTDLSLLYYDRGEYKNCYKMSKRAIKLYEDGYAYEDDDDILREALVKGAAAAYNLGEYRDSEKMLKKMISLDLRGSEENRKTYMGWAYYYLSNIERVRGNYDRSHYYGGISINYCPYHNIFLDYWNGFYYVGSLWHWRHHSHHDYRPPMPPTRPHRSDYRLHHKVQKPLPMHHDRDSVKKPAPVMRQRQQAPAHQPRHEMQKPVDQKHTIQRPTQHKPAVNQQRHAVSQSRPEAQRSAQQKPVFQHKTVPQHHAQQGQTVNQSRPEVQRPAQQRPVYQHKPAVNQQRHAVSQSRPEVQRPAQQRPVYQHKPAVNQQRHTVSQSRPEVQRPAQQRPVYQHKPAVNQSRPAVERSSQQKPVYQKPTHQSRKEVQRDNQYPGQYQAPHGGHKKR